ncbi:hypothetical protein HBI56_053770 [Parastagonospora nodorum]|nr:hypothetical protein HBH52_086160 [Parastagonospora nodorum]KAH4003219.1 hypothetical protein HBI10_066760 [Parastagonospora nodorum]KAH4028154.1 hypothetical protein HBI13_051240 [Parastagonospora nodorum]KAH4093457.1 hypothetical protein HBH46_178050 [Parastagonospora nodorum]KAH4227115.1 hypothetical protein HBI06_105570 [Parastagonospora nodorum]
MATTSDVDRGCVFKKRKLLYYHSNHAVGLKHQLDEYAKECAMSSCSKLCNDVQSKLPREPRDLVYGYSLDGGASSLMIGDSNQPGLENRDKLEIFRHLSHIYNRFGLSTVSCQHN